jgi:hypothetical protein
LCSTEESLALTGNVFIANISYAVPEDLKNKPASVNATEEELSEPFATSTGRVITYVKTVPATLTFTVGEVDEFDSPFPFPETLVSLPFESGEEKSTV